MVCVFITALEPGNTLDMYQQPAAICNSAVLGTHGAQANRLDGAETESGVVTCYSTYSWVFCAPFYTNTVQVLTKKPQVMKSLSGPLSISLFSASRCSRAYSCDSQMNSC